MKLFFFVVLVGIFAIAGIYGLSLAAEKEGFSELYFEDHTSLPSIFAGEELRFAFGITNYEKEDVEYLYIVYLEEEDKKLVDQGSVIIGAGSSAVIENSVALDSDFEAGRVIVELENTGQSIHFGVRR